MLNPEEAEAPSLNWSSQTKHGTAAELLDMSAWPGTTPSREVGGGVAMKVSGHDELEWSDARVRNEGPRVRRGGDGRLSMRPARL